jgi:hypothetical protein
LGDCWPWDWGLVILAHAAIAGRIAQDRPRIAAHVERASDGIHVKGKVSAEGLTANEYVSIRIVGISTRDRLAEAHVGHQRGKEATVPCPHEDAGETVPGTALALSQPKTETSTGAAKSPSVVAPKPTRKARKPATHCWRQLIYTSRTGATSDGKVDVDLDSPIATGIYERLDVEAVLLKKDEISKRGDRQGLREPRCDKNSTEFGCVTLMLPPGPRRPALDARWETPASSPPMLAVTARMDELAVDDRVVLSVRRELGKGKWARVYGASWAPNAAGVVDEKLSIPVTTRRLPLCVIMRTLKGSVEPLRESAEAYGPCHPRSQGMAVQLYAPPHTTSTPRQHT